MLYSGLMLDSILDFLFILIAALSFSWFFRKIRLPPILGSILAGLILGPSGFGLIKVNQNPLAYQWLIFLGSMGGLVLVFLVGLESSIKEIISFSKPALTVGSFGLGFSFILVALFSWLFGLNTVQALILGTGVSMSSTIPALTTIMSMKKGNTRAARIFTVSSLVDDIFGLITLFLIINAFGKGYLDFYGLLIYLGTLAVFWIVSLTIIPRISSWAYRYFSYPSEQTTTILTFIFILVAALLAEDFLYEASFGVFLLGLAFSTLHPLYKYEIKKVFLNLGDALLFPLFFILIGLNANLQMITSQYWLEMAVGVIILAILGKILGAEVGGFLTKLKSNESLAIGLSLVPRGGVTLVIGALALSKGLISQPIFAMLVLLVILTTILAPFFASIGFSRVKE